MPPGGRRASIGLLLVALACAACSALVGKEYEYEEELYLDIDGAATIYVNASIAALVALHGAALDPGPEASPDPVRVRELFSAPGADVGTPSFYRRDGRRFVRVSVSVPAVASLQRVGPLAWSTYTLTRTGGPLVFHQTVGRRADTPAAGRAWTGQEVVAFRLHAPSKVLFENATSEVQRGNILAWEQPLSDRLAGAPLDLRVEMQPESILRSTLLLFGSAAVAALAVFAFVIWRLVRRGRAELASGR